MDRITALVEELMVEGRPWYGYGLKDFVAGLRLLVASAEEKRKFVMVAIERLNRLDEPMPGYSSWPVRAAMLDMLDKRRLPFEHDDVIALLDWANRQPHNYYRGTPQMVGVVERYLEGHELTPALREQIGRLVARLEYEYSSVTETCEYQVRLRELGSLPKPSTSLVAGEAWSDAAIDDVEATDGETRAAWVELLEVCQKASCSKPTSKWLKTANPLLEKIGFPGFKSAVSRWFSLVDRSRTQPIERYSEWEPDPNLLIHPLNADALKGLAWLCAGREDGEIPRALMALALSTYRKVPQIGPRCVKVGNACV
jgi:hypothetical protein